VTRTAVAGAIVAGLALFAAGASHTAGDSLADVAARERARRERIGATADGKVLTQEDLDRVRAEEPERAPDAAPSPQDEATAAAGASAPDQAGPDKGDGAEEAAGDTDGSQTLDEDAQRRLVTARIRGQYKAAEERVERARADLEQAQAERAKLPDVPLAPGALYGSIMRADERVQQAEAALDRAEQRLDEIADEARRAGVYPGDLRN
jgi:hypothetical protein